MVATVCVSGEVTLFDNRLPKSILKAHNQATSVWLNNDLLVTGGKDGIIKLFDIRNDAVEMNTFKISDNDVLGLDVIDSLILISIDQGCVTGLDFK